MSQISKPEIFDVNGNCINEDAQIKILKDIEGLPATKYLSEIQRALKESPIVIIEGATGSGKSTQVPKIIARELVENKNSVSSLITTQPRVSAAAGLANRFSEEMQYETLDQSWELGNLVGYKTGRGSSGEKLSPISYNTSMYELMRLSHGGKMPTHYMLDEIHTDDIGNLALARIIKDALIKNRGEVKLLLSSATMNKQKLEDYFKEISKDIPSFEIEGRTYPIEELHGKSREFDPYISDFISEGKHILIFEDGKKSIEATREELEKQFAGRVKVFEFHSDTSIEDQKQIIDYQPAKGESVIIVATNAAEESLTIPYLNAVIDKGFVKQASIDFDGIERLDKVNASLASYKQRIGRSGRTAPATTVRVNDTDIEDIDNFKTPEITLTSLEREILQFSKMGENLFENIAAKIGSDEKYFMDDPDARRLKLSYERLCIHGAVDKDGNITELGESCLTYPTSFFNAKILVEAEKRGVLKDAIDMVTILEGKGFLKPGRWQDLYKQNRANSISDLSLYVQIFKQFTAKELDEKTLNFLSDVGGLGFDFHDEFKKGEKMLFELVDEEALEEYGINKSALEKMCVAKEKIIESAIKNNRDINSTGTKDDLVVSILSGMLHNIFEYDRETSLYHGIHQTKTKKEFTQSNVSVMEPHSLKKTKKFVGVPFTIGATDTQEDFHLLQFITSVDAHHLSEFQNDLQKNIPNFNIEHYSPRARAIQKFKSLLPKRDYEEIDISAEQKASYDDILPELEISSEYAKLLNVLQDIESGKITKRELKDTLAAINQTNVQIVELQKSINWFKNLIESLDEAIKTGNFSLRGITYGYQNPEQIFLHDPLFKEKNLTSDILEIKNEYHKLQKILSKSIVIDLFNDEKALSIFHGHNSALSIFSGLEENIKDLFFSDSSRGKNQSKNQRKKQAKKILHFISKVNKVILHIEEKHASGEINQRQLTSYKKQLKNLKTVLTNIRKANKNLQSSIGDINFGELYFKAAKGNANRVYTEGYLYHIIEGIIFDNSADHRGIDDKIMQKLKRFFGSSISENEAYELSHLISSYTNDIDSPFYDIKAKDRLAEFKEKSEDIQQEKKNQKNNYEEKVKNLKQGYYNETSLYIKDILTHFFEEEYINEIDTEIHKFVSKFYNINIKDFDRELQKFIFSLSPEFLLYDSDFFKNIDDYKYYTELITKHFGKDIKSLLYNRDTTLEEIESEIGKLTSAKRKLEHIQKAIQEKRK